MRPSKHVEKLAEQIAARHKEDSPSPFILFLGTQCARAAGVPGPKEMARPVLDDLFERDPALATALLPQGDQADEAQRVQAFLNLLGGMSSVQRHGVLRPFYSRVPVPLFYQDLAALIRAGYFSHILTTNIDSLFEQALNGAGLQRGVDYQVIVLSVPPDTAVRPRPMNMSQVPVTIIKLHGDLGQSEIPITPDEIENALRSQRQWVKGELKGDMVMVGYEFESEPVNSWLSKTPGGDLWWVSPERPDHQRIGPIEQARPVIYIEKEAANPQAFFGQLVLMLLRLPVLKSMSTPFEAYTRPEEVAGPAPSDDELEIEYVRGQLRRSQEVLYRLRQSLVPGEPNVQLEAQIEYQRKICTELEDQLRELFNDKHRVVELMEQIATAASKARTDPDTMSFLWSQIDTVKGEYARDRPNRHVVSAAIGAAVVLAQRLGAEVVNPDLLRELTSFAPSASSRGA